MVSGLNRVWTAHGGQVHKWLSRDLTSPKQQLWVVGDAGGEARLPPLSQHQPFSHAERQTRLTRAVVCPSRTILVLNRGIGKLPQVPGSWLVSQIHFFHCIFFVRLFVLHREGDKLLMNSESFLIFCINDYSFQNSSRRQLPINLLWQQCYSYPGREQEVLPKSLW